MARTPTFRARFEAMVETLQAHPKVKVFKVEVRPPAKPADILAAEKAIGSPLPPALRKFYAAHDGVFLEWGLAGRKYSDRTRPFGSPDYGQPPGCINLLPVRKAMSASWQRDSHINDIDDELRERMFRAVLDPPPKVAAVCVDNFSKYNHGDLIVGPRPMMLVSTDHGADVESSHWVEFPTYLDLTLAIFGADRYDHGLGVRGVGKTRFKPEWTKSIKLDTLLRKLAEDDRGEEI